jgi:hypothetical protein
MEKLWESRIYFESQVPLLQNISEPEPERRKRGRKTKDGKGKGEYKET